jgi:hypothetical protein
LVIIGECPEEILAANKRVQLVQGLIVGLFGVMCELSPNLRECEPRQGQLFLIISLLAHLRLEHALEKLVQTFAVQVVIEEQSRRVFTQLKVFNLTMSRYLL